MGNFNRGSNNRSSGGFRGGNRFGGRDSGRSFGGNREVTMHTTTCDNCGNQCEVPFKPTGEKPVYCSNCFKTMRGDDDGGSTFNRRDDRGGDRGNRSFDRNDRFEKQMFPAVCDNCGNKCEVPFKPSGDKPVYCSNCFEKNDGRSDRNNSSNSGFKVAQQPDTKVAEQLEALNAKLDKLISALIPKQESKVTLRFKNEGDAKADVIELGKKPEADKAEVSEKPAKKATIKKVAVKKVAKKK